MTGGVLAGRNLRWEGVDIDYDTLVEYEGSDGERNTIEHAAVRPNIDLDRLAEVWKPQTVWQRYGAQRLLATAHLQSSDFEVQITDGYYGDEIGDIHLNRFKAQALDEGWCEFLALPADRRIPYLLEREYGHLLKDLQERTFEIEEVATDRLIFGAPDHYQRFDQDTVTRYREAMLQAAREHTVAAKRHTARPPGIPQGVVIPDEDDHYRIADGYQRLGAAAQANRAKVLVYVARDSAS